MQLTAPVPVKMEVTAQLLAIAPVMWGGQDSVVKKVRHTFLSDVIHEQRITNIKLALIFQPMIMSH